MIGFFPGGFVVQDLYTVLFCFGDGSDFMSSGFE